MIREQVTEGLGGLSVYPMGELSLGLGVVCIVRPKGVVERREGGLCPAEQSCLITEPGVKDGLENVAAHAVFVPVVRIVGGALAHLGEVFDYRADVVVTPGELLGP